MQSRYLLKAWNDAVVGMMPKEQLSDYFGDDNWLAHHTVHYELEANGLLGGLMSVSRLNLSYYSTYLTQSINWDYLPRRASLTDYLQANHRLSPYQSRELFSARTTEHDQYIMMRALFRSQAKSPFVSSAGVARR